MTPCNSLDDFLAKLLTDGERAAFEAHLQICEACRVRVAKASEIDVIVADFLVRKQTPEITESDLIRLKRKVQSRSQGHNRSRNQRAIGLSIGGMVAACLIAIAIIGWPNFSDPIEKEIKREPVGQQVEVVSLITENATVSSLTQNGPREFKVAAGGLLVVRAGKDRLSFSQLSQAILLTQEQGEDRIRLHHGAMAISAAPRSSGQRLFIEVGHCLVTVIGTRFLVERREDLAVVVSVTDGQVRVTDPAGKNHLVSAGRRLTVPATGPTDLAPLSPAQIGKIDKGISEGSQDFSMSDSEKSTDSVVSEVSPLRPVPDEVGVRLPSQPNAPHSEKKPDTGGPGKAPADESTILQWMVSGEFVKAETEIEWKIRINPNSASDWWLLGECRRKRGSSARAVVAYQKVISTGSAAQANRARFQAAALLQDSLGNPSEAVVLFEAYLSADASVRPLDAETRLRMGRGYITLGRLAQARKILLDLQNRHPGTVEAAAARLIQPKLGADGSN